MGKLIVIEGLDGSGKSTQLDLLFKGLEDLGKDSKWVSFPDYESNSSALVKMYLGGEYGDKPDDIIGMLNTRDFLLNTHAKQRKTTRQLLRKPYMVPETIITVVGCVVLASIFDLSSPVIKVRKAKKD